MIFSSPEFRHDQPSPLETHIQQAIQECVQSGPDRLRVFMEKYPDIFAILPAEQLIQIFPLVNQVPAVLKRYPHLFTQFFNQRSLYPQDQTIIIEPALNIAITNIEDQNRIIVPINPYLHQAIREMMVVYEPGMFLTFSSQQPWKGSPFMPQEGQYFRYDSSQMPPDEYIAAALEYNEEPFTIPLK